MSGSLSKSHSLPGLYSFGVNNNSLYPKPKDVTLNVSWRGKEDSQHAPASESADKAMQIAGLMKHPSWRIAELENFPRVEKTKPAERVPQNMKHPRVSPAWLKHDKQVLRFYGFFQEHVVERWDENCRFRNVVFSFFMEDGTMNVTEPKVENSGLMQGQFLKRHRATKGDGSYLNPLDFRVGEDLYVYGVRYHITGADRFTRWFFGENGWDLAEDEPQMRDQWQKSYTFNKIAEKGGLPLTKMAKEGKELSKYMSGQAPTDRKLVQFLLNDRKVLRFKAYWDDNSLYGNRIYFTIHYYLADNTCEINEAHARNSGRDAYPVFYKRGPLVKDPKVNVYPGMLEPEPDIVLPKDLVVGSSIRVWRRKLEIYDCDDFTQKFFKEYMDMDNFKRRIDVAEPPKSHQKLTPPPNTTGIGTDEDSLMNCEMIRPKPAKKDLARMMTLTGEVLRFEARMVNGEPEDENRRFILGYFPADDHIACWELPVRNSGHMAGKFMEKGRKKNPDTGKYFTLEEFAIGKTLCIAAQPMLVLRADEHTLQWLEGHTELFPHAHPGYCVSQLAPIAGHPYLQDPRGIDPDTLKNMAADSGVDLLDHEIITLLRNFCINSGGDNSPPLLDGPAMLQVLQDLYAQQ